MKKLVGEAEKFKLYLQNSGNGMTKLMFQKRSNSGCIVNCKGLRLHPEKPVRKQAVSWMRNDKAYFKVVVMRLEEKG